MDSDRFRPPLTRARLWDWLSLERPLTGEALHLVYWSGLAIILLIAFSVIGAAVGVAIRDVSWISILLALPVLVGGLAGVVVMSLLWRSVCEFYATIVRISDDLAALRQAAEKDSADRPR